MGQGVAYKVLSSHLVGGTMQPGQSIDIKIDQTLTQDATGTMTYLQFESLGLDHIRNELAVSYIDHNTVQVGFENADDHLYLQSIAEAKGMVFSRPGNGICHQVQLERFGIPGKTLIGADSHTPTGGGLGMIAIGAGGLDVALAMAGVPFSIICPKVIEIRLHNKLRPFCSAKDVILTVLERFGVKGNVNTVFEYTGDGVESLSIPERATICNMGAECGVTTSIFPSDKNTKAFLKARGREGDFVPLTADADAKYDGLFEIDLSKVVPMAACPHSPGNVKKVSELAGLKVNQVAIGSCTNSSYADLYKVGKILSGKVVSETVCLGVAPGTRDVLRRITADGTLADLVASGARIQECTCGFCIGNHFSPNSKGVSLRTNNRNFEGRSGTKDAQVYLVSPETAAASALTGVVTDPTSLGLSEIVVPEVESSVYNDNMFIFPKPNREPVKIIRGPNIGEPPKSKPLSKTVNAVVGLKVGDNITTDHISPAGSKLKYRSNIKKYSAFVFEPVDPTFPERAANYRDKGISTVIVAGKGYGQGSSREHAAICPMYLGVKALMALSIERIHKANLCNFGILPLTFINEKDYERLNQGDELVIENAIDQVNSGKDIVVKNISGGYDFEMKLDVSDLQRQMLIVGGRLNQIKEAL